MVKNKLQALSDTAPASRMRALQPGRAPSDTTLDHVLRMDELHVAPPAHAAPALSAHPQAQAQIQPPIARRRPLALRLGTRVPGRYSRRAHTLGRTSSGTPHACFA